MKEIPLHNRSGDIVFVTLVDDEDYEWLSQLKWWAGRDKKGKCTSVCCKDPEVGSRRTLRMHRVLLGYDGPDMVDHKDRNPLNNQKDNLRIATRSQNGANSTQEGDGYKGVHRKRRGFGWEAYIGLNGKRIFWGGYGTEEDAARAYNKAAVKLFGEFALLNDLDDPLKPVVSLGGKHKNKNGFKGVFKTSWGSFKAVVYYKSKMFVVGHYKTSLDCALAYDAFITKQGWSKPLNFPCTYQNLRKNLNTR